MFPYIFHILPIGDDDFVQIAEHLEPKLHALIAALAGSDSQQVHLASASLSEETKMLKKELLGGPKNTAVLWELYRIYMIYIWHFDNYKYGNLLHSYGK